MKRNRSGECNIGTQTISDVLFLKNILRNMTKYQFYLIQVRIHILYYPFFKKSFWVLRLLKNNRKK